MAAQHEAVTTKRLSETEVNKRRDLLAARLKEKADVEAEKSSAVKKWNETLRLLDEQITTLGEEIRLRHAMIPAQLDLPAVTGADQLGQTESADADGDEEPVSTDDYDGDGVVNEAVPGKKAKKKRASRKRAAA